MKAAPLALTIILAVMLTSGCVRENPYKIKDGDHISLKVGESMLLVKDSGSDLGISGGFIPAFYVSNRSVADLEIKNGGLYLRGKNPGRTTGVATSKAYLNDNLTIRDEDSGRIIESSLKDHPVWIVVSE